MSNPIQIRSKVSVFERPPTLSDGSGSTLSEYTIKYSNFDKPQVQTKGKRGKVSESKRYIIIGFDTEFQALSDNLTREQVRMGEAKYEVLSYQFHCSTSDGKDWSGLCCPADGERISLGDFIIFALAKGISEAAVKRLPTTIYLVGHFTRADFPAFSDFKTMQSQISAVRNTFLSLSQHIPLQLSFPGSKEVMLRVSLRDTMLLTPGTSKSLDALGQLVGRPKIRLDPDKQKEKELKGRMKFVRDTKWDLFQEYALNDAVICVEYLEKIIEQTKLATGANTVPITLTSIGIDLLIDSWKKDFNKNLNDVLGKEEIVERKWNKKFKYYQKVKKTVTYEEVNIHEQLATESYHGGRNEQFWFGPCYDANWTDFDLSSAYPTAMALIGLPLWREARVTTDLADFQPDALAYGWVDFKFPEHVRYPTLPVRTENGLVFPLEGSSYCAAPEISLARDLGCEIHIKHGVLIPSDRSISIFGQFIRSALENRAKHPKKSLDALFWKEISNSTYGKTAQGLRAKRVYDMQDATMKPLPPSKITNPFLASFITSFVRAVLGEIINSLPANRMVLSCTTDGFLTDANQQEIDKAQSGTLGRLFAESRKSLTGTESVLETKNVIRQPLGWRTRGQATLKSGKPNPDDNSYNVILARGGISIPDEVDDPEDRSKWICDLFFNRKPGDIVTSRSLTGIRDIVELDSDLVGVTIKRRLNMEFDWKRRPFAVGTSKEYDHLVFSTKPWRTVEEFKKVRMEWNEYQNADFRCLKTVEDFKRFQTFFQSRMMLDDKNRTYLKSVDPDFGRLRQSLCSAWKKAKAGFEVYHAEAEAGTVPRLSASQFAALLTQCGIPTKRTDVENNAKRDFVACSCPPTERCQEAFKAINQTFRTLRFVEIFSAPRGASILETDNSAACEFVLKVV